MKIFLFIVLFGVVSTSVGEDKPALQERQAKVAADVTAIPLENAQFILYSLDPTGRFGYEVNTENVFHGFTILGKAEISDPKDKNALITAFARGIRENQGVVAMCFNPRHGIRLVIGTATYDFVICFECESVMTYGFNTDQGFLTTGFAKPLFNEYLDRLHLKKAHKNG